jgi:hypothetical protein
VVINPRLGNTATTPTVRRLEENARQSAKVGLSCLSFSHLLTDVPQQPVQSPLVESEDSMAKLWPHLGQVILSEGMSFLLWLCV